MTPDIIGLAWIAINVGYLAWLIYDEITAPPPQRPEPDYRRRSYTGQGYRR